MKLLRNVKILFTDSYYDGPLSGICVYREKYFYFRLHDELIWDEVKYYNVRVYNIYKLPKEEIDIVIHNQLLFKRLISEMETNKVSVEYEKLKKPTKTDEKHEDFIKNFGVCLVGYALDDMLSYTEDDTFRVNGL